MARQFFTSNWAILRWVKTGKQVFWTSGVLEQIGAQSKVVILKLFP